MDYQSGEEVKPAPPALTLEIDDKKLVQYIRAYEKASKSFYTEKKFPEKIKRNERFYFGRQIDPETRTYKGFLSERQLKSYEKPFSDNILKEGEDTLRPLILSRLPDLIVKPGTEGDEVSRQSAEEISKVVNNALTSRELKKVLTKSTRHHPIYYTGVIKYRWDSTKGKNGDTVFESIHPKNIVVDHTATENNERAMKIIIHYVEKSIKDWILLFPQKEAELIAFARKKGKLTGNADEKAMAVNLKLSEVWFRWHEKAEDYDPENPQFKFESGVAWLADDEVLDKRKNPNWDWDGEEKYFFNGRPLPEELVSQVALMGFNVPGIERKQTFRNFFGTPRLPFIFLGYEQYGEHPLDEISRIEENLLLQENYDWRGMQITKMIDDARGKHVFSTLSGLKKSTVEEMDLSDSDEDILVDGDLRQVHSFISKEQPSAAMFNDAASSRERILARLHVHGATRGEIEVSTATSNQIAREADFSVADDIADDTINEVATQMAEALLHMMKLRYEEEHFTAILGEKGRQTYLELRNDMIEDGMEVEIFASGTDKLKAERQAKDEAQLGLIDPLTYYKDTGRSDPEGRAEKLFLFQTMPELYYKKYIKGEDVPTLAEQVMLASQQRLAQVQQPMGQPTAPQAPMGGPMRPSPAQPGAVPQLPQGPPPASPRNIIGAAGQALGRMFGR